MLSYPLFVATLQLRQPSLKCFAEDTNFYSAQVLLAIAGVAHPDSSKGCRKQVAFLQNRLPGTDFHLGAVSKKTLCYCSLQEPRPLPSQKCLITLLDSLEHLGGGGGGSCRCLENYVISRFFLRIRSWLKDRNSKPCPHWGREKPKAAQLSSWLPFLVENIAEGEAEIIKSEERELQKNLKETRLHQLHHSDSNLFSQLPK